MREFLELKIKQSAEAREIIRECEEYKRGNDSDYAKAAAERSAYERLKEIFLGESPGGLLREGDA